MPLDSSSAFKPKYNFHLLQIGEEMFVPGKPTNIRSAAANWGRRYGVWLTTQKAVGGLKVKRNSAPHRPSSKRKEDLYQRIQRIEDGIRFLAIITVKIKGLLEEKQ